MPNGVKKSVKYQTAKALLVEARRILMVETDDTELAIKLDATIEQLEHLSKLTMILR